jgi:o-succinylbenzoate synthase
MELTASFEKKTFQFKRPSGTSRGVLTEKHAWFISVWDKSNPSIKGLGECSIIDGLSPDFKDFNSYEKNVKKVTENINYYRNNIHELKEFPSIYFGLETALLDLKNGGKKIFFESDFTHGKSRIPINGLVWMGSIDFMKAQVTEKINAGFKCIKIKIGAINFKDEIDLLKSIRNDFPKDEIMLRVDANGAFTPENAMERLDALHQLSIHSIEQPILPNQWQEMAQLCKESPLPIALDEELIGHYNRQSKENLLDRIQPQFLILKPSLHGGLRGTREWIKLAEERNIEWWITSALESNIGLNAIAQFTATFDNLSFQGLGTGMLYTNNIPSKLLVSGGYIYFK